MKNIKEIMDVIKEKFKDIQEERKKDIVRILLCMLFPLITEVLGQLFILGRVSFYSLVFSLLAGYAMYLLTGLFPKLV
nr:hypothetical protein [Lachnospiraceae bacterium]